MATPVATAPAGLPTWLAEPLSWVGLRWPEGDAARLSAAGEAWSELAQTLRAQKESADRAATAVWGTNRGEEIDVFRSWWNGTGGPSTNLRRAADAAARIGTALSGLSTQVTILKAAYIGQLALLVAALVAAGVVVVGSGGIAAVGAAAGTAFLVNLARRAMVRRLQATVVAVTAVIVGVLLRKAMDELVVADPPAQPAKPKRKPDPYPDPVPVPPPLPGPRGDPPRRPRCKSRPVPPLGFTPYVENADPRYHGGGLQRIVGQQGDGGRRIVTIDGVVDDPTSDRDPTFAREPLIARDSIGLSDPGQVQRYHVAHLWGPGFGSEAAAGMYLAPAAANQGLQAMGERYVRDMHERATAEGGWVELRAVATTHAASEWYHGGGNLLARADYEATLCHDRGIQEALRFGIEVDPPTGQPHAFTPGRARPYVLPLGN